MPNQLDLPDELKHLIEKRDDGDRRDRPIATPVEPAPPATTDAERRQSGRRADDAEKAESEEPNAE